MNGDAEDESGVGFGFFVQNVASRQFGVSRIAAAAAASRIFELRLGVMTERADDPKWRVNGVNDQGGGRRKAGGLAS